MVPDPGPSYFEVRFPFPVDVTKVSPATGGLQNANGADYLEGELVFSNGFRTGPFDFEFELWPRGIFNSGGPTAARRLLGQVNKAIEVIEKQYEEASDDPEAYAERLVKALNIRRDNYKQFIELSQVTEQSAPLTDSDPKPSPAAERSCAVAIGPIRLRAPENGASESELWLIA